MPVLLHDFPEDTEDIPQSVRELSQLIYRPLPASLARVEASTLCSIAQVQLKTVSLQQCNEDGGNEDREPLHGVLNLVLMSPAAMAACVRIAMSGGERRRMDMFMFPLFRTLARVCHEECFVSGSVPFIWPKDFSDEQGIATMLISFGADESVLRLQDAHECAQSAASDKTTVEENTDDATPSESRSENNQRVQSHSAASDYDNDNDNFEGEATCDDDTDGATEQGTEDGDLSQPDSGDTETDDDDDSEDSDSEEETSEESFQWYANAGGQLYNPKYLQQVLDRLAGRVPQEEPLLDLPLYTQILTGQRIWPNVYFPAVCVADSSNIVAHVASVAYQRRVWGVELPVVGLEVSSIGSGVRAYIGWLDPPSDDVALPSAHIIKPAVDVRGLTAQAAAAQGVFDLAHMQSALLFAQFFLALRPQFLHLQSSVSVQHLSKLEWRSDYNNATWTADIDGWAQQIDKSEDTSASASPCASAESHSMNDNLMEGKVRSSTSSAQSSVQSKRNSCSAFADLKVNLSIAGDASVTTWLVHRSAFLETKFIFDGHVGPPLYKGQGNFEKMCQLYDELTSFRWVEDWKALEDLPAVPASLRALRQELYDQCRQVFEEPRARIYVDDKYARIIYSRLTLLLACADGISTRSSVPERPLEVEGRREWDAMLSYFYVEGEDEVVSYNMLLECELRMPRNSLLDILNGGDAELRGKLQSPFLSWAKRNREVYTHLANIYNPEDVSSTERDDTADHEAAFLSQIASAGDYLSQEYRKLLKAPAVFRDIAQAQAGHEPSSGMCDAVLFFSPSFGATGADISRQAQETYGKGIRLVIGNTHSQHERQRSLGLAGANQTQLKHLDQGLYPLSTPRMDEYAAELSSQIDATQIDAALPKYRKCSSPMDIILPQLIAVYNKPGDSEAKTLNEARMYCVAAVEFLAAVGIKSYPVFGLVVHSSVGTVLMAWMAEDGTTHILDRNIRQYDLAKPLEAFQFGTFLLRLKAREELLKDKFEKCRAEFVDNLANGKFKNWTMDLST